MLHTLTVRIQQILLNFGIDISVLLLILRNKGASRIVQLLSCRLFSSFNILWNTADILP
ncbi:hypothetical protein D3C73_1344510 [compost metagenome]